MDLEHWFDSDIDKKNASGLDHTFLFSLGIFGNSNKLLTKGASSKQISVKYNDVEGNEIEGVGDVSFGHFGQPQEPQFELFTDLLLAWDEESTFKYGSDFDINSSEHRSLSFKSINSLLAMQGKSRGSVAMNNLLRDIELLKHVNFSFNLDQKSPVDFIVKDETSTNAAISNENIRKGEDLIVRYDFKSKPRDKKGMNYTGFVELGQYFCEKVKNGMMITYNKSIYKKDKLGKGSGKKLYRCLNILDYEEKRKEIKAKNSNENYITKTIFKYELKELLFDVLNHNVKDPDNGPSDKEIKRWKNDLKNQLAVFISSGLLDPSDEISDCFITEGVGIGKKTFVLLKLGPFFKESDRHKAEEEFLEMNAIDRSIIQKLKRYSVSEGYEFIGKTKINKTEEVSFCDKKNKEKTFSFPIGEFSQKRLVSICKWYELRDRLKKNHIDHWPSDMEVHRSHGVLNRTITFDMFPWEMETEKINAILKTMEENKKNKNNKSLSNDDSVDDSDVTSAYNKRKDQLNELLNKHMMAEEDSFALCQKINRVIGNKKDSFMKTWFPSDRFVVIEDKKTYVKKDCLLTNIVKSLDDNSSDLDLDVLDESKFLEIALP